MYKIKQKTLNNAYKPFDVVTNRKGDVGFIQEVSVNDCQPDPKHQIRYAVKWLVGHEYKHAWFVHKELTMHCNLFVKIAESACHPMGRNESKVQSLFNAMNRDT